MNEFHSNPIPSHNISPAWSDLLADEFKFGAPHPTPLFKSRRAKRRGSGLRVRVVPTPSFLPKYQIVGRVIGFSTFVEQPSIGFAIKATGTVQLNPRDKAIPELLKA